jgi:hypothetical protein
MSSLLKMSVTIKNAKALRYKTYKDATSLNGTRFVSHLCLTRLLTIINRVHDKGRRLSLEILVDTRLEKCCIFIYLRKR